MIKTQAALVTAVAACTMLATTAEAGMKVRLGFGFPLGSFTAHGNSGGGAGDYSERRRKSRQHYVGRKETSKVKVSNGKSADTVAKAEPEAPLENVDKVNAQSENSSISTAAVTPVVETPTGDDTAGTSAEGKAAVKSDCKKFFPSVGMTLTVPCE
jgi:hypothetical protein